MKQLLVSRFITFTGVFVLTQSLGPSSAHAVYPVTSLEELVSYSDLIATPLLPTRPDEAGTRNGFVLRASSNIPRARLDAHEK